MKELIFNLCKSIGVSGDESAAAKAALQVLKQYSDASVDNNGNVIAVLGDKDSNYTVMLDAHLDQIGFTVTFIDERGFIKAEPCGGIDRRVVQGSLFTVLGKKQVSAVACCLPPHLSDGGEDSAVSADNLWFDTGLSPNEVKQLISVGDSVIFNSTPQTLIKSRVTAPALDNRAGAAAVITAAQLLSEASLNCKVVIVLSVQEETTTSGAKTSSFCVYPDEAIVVDVSFAGQYGVPPEKSGEMGKGPMIGIAPSLDRGFSQELINIARDKNINYQTEIMGGATGTNADGISNTKGGIKTALISIPLKNMHTPCEIVDIDDVKQTAKLIYEYITERSAGLCPI